MKRLDLKSVGQGVLVSTVELRCNGIPIPHHWGDKKDCLYETAIKTQDGEIDVVERYQTELEAVCGHKQWCTLVGADSRRSAYPYLYSTCKAILGVVKALSCKRKTL